ncbi:MAG: hypothetical protein MJ175_07305 [Clostridia bacterium]|nr:hypothetical protein [Clostridia bacterium]
MTYHIINPAAGQGGGEALLNRYYKDGDIVYHTTGVGDAAKKIEELARTDEAPYFIVYGGDGTLNEAVNGIMAAGAGDRAVLSAIPAGTGNDFVRTFADEPDGTEHTLDLIRVNGAYAVNMINIGFDCSVVSKTAEWKKKPFISGSAAYIFGVASVLFRRMGRKMKITYTDENDTEHTVEEELLLCAAANAPYCGGGFRAAPCADLGDGMIDLLIVRKISRIRFVTLVKHYHDGTHVTGEGRPAPKFAPILDYVRCRSAAIEGIAELCRDGEVLPAEKATLESARAALRYRVLH